MCGFAGIVGRPDAAVVTRMLDAIRHRGPDDRGMFMDERACLGHNRLSIIDLARGRQPLGNEDGRYQIVYNGEVYNFRRLRQQLGDRHRWATSTDTEVLVHLFEEQGPDFVRQLDGMFAFAIYDRHTGAVTMARDPLGIKPLYYGYAPDGSLCFASEIKALLKATPDVRVFPPGTVYHSAIGFRRYFAIEPSTEPLTDAEQAIPLLRRTLEEAVKKRLIADVPVGVFLSGGLDSSLVAAVARRHKEPLPSFAVGTAGSSDLKAAQEVSEYLGTDHHAYVMTPGEIRRVLPEVIEALESFDPALVRGAVATYFVSRLAAEHVKVVLTGEGADELFSGYDYLKEFGSERELERELLYITYSLHNTNLQRADRLTMLHSIEARVPFLDVAMVRAAFSLSPRLKLHGQEKVGKWILRKVAEGYLPDTIIWRAKEKFAIGTGTADALREWAASQVSDADFHRHRRLPNGFEIKSKEELYYYQIFRELFPPEALDAIVAGMGRSRSLDPHQRYA